MTRLSRFRRLGCVVTSLAACAAGTMFVGGIVDALPAGTPPAGAMVMNPPTGDSSTSIALTFASNPQNCPGDAIASFRWTTFIVPRTTDLASLTWTPSGNPLSPAFSGSLRTPTGVAVRAQNPGLGDGLVVPPLAIDFASTAFATITPGDYWAGIACTKSDGTVVQTEKFWSLPMTITAAAGAGPNNFTYTTDTSSATTTTVAGATTTTVAGATTTTVAGATTTTVAGATTTTVAGATTTTVAGATTTTVAGSAAQAATLSPAVPTPGGLYRVTHPNCRVGDTITVTQPQSTPTTQTATCAVPVAGLVRPQQAPTVGTATVTFTAAPTAAGTYTVTSSGPNSGTRTATFTIAAAASTPASSGGSPSGTSTGTIPATGSSTTSVIVWGILLLVFGRMAILLGRKPKVIQAGG